MDIISNRISFKGYDACKLDGVMVIDKDCAESLKKLSSHTGLDVYTPNIASKSIKKERQNLMDKKNLLWTQDYLTFIKTLNIKAVLYDNSRNFLKRVLRATTDGIKKDFGFVPFGMENNYLRGGNFFICENNGKKEMLLSENKERLLVSEAFKKVYGVENVHLIPRLDYHLDLFIRPIGNGNVLVADNEATKIALKNGFEIIQKYIQENNPDDKEKEELKNVLEKIEYYLKKLDITEEFSEYNPKETTPKVISALREAGYNPIPVPASYCYLKKIIMDSDVQEYMNNFKSCAKTLLEWSENQSDDIKDKTVKYLYGEALKTQYNKNIGMRVVNMYENNFVNAIVSKNSDGKLVYITNAPLFDKVLGITPEIEQKTGFSTKNMFLESIKSYIDKENIYFIDEKTTQKLFKYMGGIHCTASEIPV